MLVAYLDEFGHVGPYINTSHGKFNEHPAFGYAGIVLPEAAVRPFGARFERIKARQFRSEIIAANKHPRRWEKKGAEIFTSGAYQRYPERVEFIADLAGYMRHLGGSVFFYGHRKPIGSKKETGLSASQLTRDVLTETVRRLCRYADRQDQPLTVLLDKGGPMPREEAITSLATFIYSKPEESLKRIIEVPMELESHRYGAIQFADWMCAITSRATHFHMTESNEFEWAPAAFKTIFDKRALSESRVWLPGDEFPLTQLTFMHRRKWLNSPASPAHRRSAHLTHTIGDTFRAQR